jgi:catecholate siderophore receptor
MTSRPMLRFPAPRSLQLSFVVPLLGLLFALSPALAAPAPMSARRAFDLPAGAAERSLKLFSTQSGLEVIFPTEIARGVRTPAVKGDFTAAEAMARLLDGTGLTAAQDERSGALTVKRGSDPNASRAAQPTPSDRPARQSAAVAPIPADEPVRRDSPSAPSANGDDATVLSPFVVNSDRDTGYQATNTLAGTRLNTPIEDIGAAVSIYTKDFITDIGATDINEMLVYATGMEASGSQGNISGISNSDRYAGTSTTREDPETGAGIGVAIRTRGLGVPTITRGFFPTSIPSDSYNTERITVNNGPNAILFGVGNPAGIIDRTLLSANPTRNMNKVELRYGNNDSLRGALDINRVLIRNKLAMRLATLYSREEYNQRPAFEEKKRIYGAGSYRPFRSTEIRANFETGRGNANRPHTVPPYHSFEAWEQAGRPLIDWTFYDDPARNPGAASQNVQTFIPLGLGRARTANQIVAVYNSPDSTAPDFSFSNIISARLPGTTFHPVLNRDSATDTFWFVGTESTFDLPAAWWPQGYIPPGIRQQTFTDYSAFNWRKRMIYESERQTHSFHSFNIALEQRALNDHVGIELAYDTQRYDLLQRTATLDGAISHHIRIDTNVTLPTGQPNPNLGRPYVHSSENTFLRDGFYDRDGMRATAFVKYDFKDLNHPWGKWLGRHVVSGLLEQNELRKLRGTTRMQTGGLPAAQINTDVLNANLRYLGVIYLGPSILDNNTQLRLEPISVPHVRSGDTFMTTYYDPAGGGLVSAPTTVLEWRNTGSADHDLVKSRGATLQSYWLREHLVTLVGWRRDQDYFSRVSYIPLRDATRTGPNDPGQVYYGFDDFDFSSTPPFLAGAEIVSYSAVLKWPTRWLKLPAGAGLSVFYNDSENLTPSAGSVDNLLNRLESPKGETKEYGLNFSAFGGKLTLRVNRFETSVLNQTFPTGGVPVAATESGVMDTISAWAQEGERNPGNVPFMQAAIAQMLSPLPSTFLDDRRFTVSGSGSDITTTYDRPQSTDTTDYVAKGMEMGITYNPTRNWRITTNLAKQETTQSNLYPNTRAFVARMQSVYDSTVVDPATGVSVNFRNIPKGGYPIGTGPANPPAANLAQRYGDWLAINLLYPLASAVAVDGVASPEQRKWRFNLVTNYNFGREVFRGKLRGWGIGGGYRWQSRIATGYPSSVDANGIVQYEIGNPYWGPAEGNVDAWLSYGRKIWNDRINWKAQLNVKNLIGDDDLILIKSQPWGAPAQMRIPPEKRWYITSTFEF